MSELGKAWFIQDKNGDSDNEIIHAETRGKAIYKSEMYHDMDFTEIRVTRLPGMDGKPVTDKNIFLAGLVVFCSSCEAFAMDEDGGDPLFDDKENAYCYRCFPVKEELIKAV